MRKKFQNKYRIESARLQKWDYRWQAAYFITICTKNRVPFFGEISNNKMSLSNLGIIADLCFYQIDKRNPYIKIECYVIMPNHIHAILRIIKNSDNGDVACNVSTANKNKFMSEIAPKSGSLSTIIRSYKSAVTKHSNRLGYDFSWQSRFHDHIIRNQKSFERISNYILNNPSLWEKDCFHCQ